MDDSGTPNPAGAAQEPRIAITICTRRRNALLRRCLESLAPQIAGAGETTALIVIENDDAPRAQSVVDEIQRAHPDARLHYMLHEDLGIPQARNRSLTEAQALGAEWIAFVDDDEWAAESWLTAMRHAIKTLDAEVITGPVDYIYLEEGPPWLGRREKSNRPTGVSMRTAATNNTVLDLSWRARCAPDVVFDEALRFTGGSDNDFFNQIRAAGGRIKWTAAAVCFENVGGDRLTMGWHIRRAQRHSAAAVYNDRKFNPGPHVPLRHLSRALRRILGGAALLPPSLLVYVVSRRAGAKYAFTCVKKIYAGWGGLQGLMRVPPQPYRDVTDG